jgi:hypothetical protein
MRRANLWNQSVSRVELDQRAREARLRLERIERQLLPRALTRSPLKRLLYLCRGGIFVSVSRESRTRGPLSDRRPSRMPTIHHVWVVRSVARQIFGSATLPDEGCGGRQIPSAPWSRSRILAVKPDAKSGRSRWRQPRRPWQPGQPSCRTSPRCGYARTAIAGCHAPSGAR